MRLARLVASGFGSGFSPVAPGTAGSLAALVIGAASLAVLPTTLPLALVSAVAGWWAIRASGEAETDPGWVVIDEFAGQFLAMMPLARPSALGLLVAFALFRLFDIGKPGPIGWADRRKNAAGIMGDDLIAGAFAALLLYALLRAAPGWFALEIAP